jgi:hypothetical protein
VWVSVATSAAAGNSNDRPTDRLVRLARVPDPLAIYASLVGTGSLGWQVWREHQRLSTDVRVEFEHSAHPRQLFVMVGNGPDRRPGPLEYELGLVVVNHGQTTEYVRHTFVRNAAETEGFDFGDMDEGDKELPPRGRVFSRVRPAELSPERVFGPTIPDRFSVDLSEGFYGYARLGSGRIVRSKLEHLDPEITRHIAEWNFTARP